MQEANVEATSKIHWEGEAWNPSFDMLLQRNFSHKYNKVMIIRLCLGNFARFLKRESWYSVVLNKIYL